MWDNPTSSSPTTRVAQFAELSPATHVALARCLGKPQVYPAHFAVKCVAMATQRCGQVMVFMEML